MAATHDTTQGAPLHEALKLAARGFKVLPIRPGQKRPPMTAWQNAATSDPTTIRTWYTGQYQGHGLAIATGHDGLFVVDVDEHHPAMSGSDTLHDLEQEHGPLPDTVEVHTGSGGRHLYFRASTPIANDAGRKLGPGLDVRGTGGQVLAPPTVHPNGRPYVWVIGRAPDEIDVAEAPAWLLERLQDRPAVTATVPQLSHRTVTPNSIWNDVDDGPAAEYNRQTTWSDLLSADGWTLAAHLSNGETRWTRPGKTTRDGISATVGWQGNDCLKVFTSSLAWLPEGAYSRFGYYACRYHAGDRSEAARSLRKASTPAPITHHEKVEPTEPWPETIPLADATNLPAFPLETLPTWIATHAQSVAGELQVPVDLPAILGLSAVSLLASSRAEVNVRSTWREQLNLYLVVALPPGAGKSPAFRQMLGPIEEWEAELVERTRTDVAAAEQKHRMLDKAMRKAEEKGDLEEAGALLLELTALNVPKPPRLAADDATPEALTQLLAEQNGRMALMSTEGGVFDLMTGRYSDKANLDVYLQAWAGDTIRIDRVGRGSLIIRNPALTIALTVQPAVLARLADHPELAGRGLTARFMYSLPADNVGKRNLVDAPAADHQIAQQYTRRLLTLARHLEKPLSAPLRFDEDALRQFLTWRQDLEHRRQPAGDLRPMAEWTTKLESSTARVAGILHLADDHTDSQPITVTTLARAIAIAEYWIQHAKAVHDLWGSDANIGKARAVLTWVTTNGLTEFSIRDLYAGNRRVFPRADDTVQPLELLLERGWLRPMFDGPIVTGRRGKSSPKFAVNPAAYAASTPAEPIRVAVDAAVLDAKAHLDDYL